VPSAQVGEKGHALTTEISISAVDSGRKPVALTSHPLKENDAAETIILDGTNSVHLLFGIDKETLSGIKPGAYTLQASFKSATIPTSEPLKIEIEKATKSEAFSVAENYRAGRYYILNHEYERVEPYAAALLSQAPVMAWELRGDSFLGLNKPREAVTAFKNALTEYDKRASNNEPPEYILARLAYAQKAAK